MIPDMVLEKFTHQAVDCPARGCQTLEDLRARRVFLQGALDRRELPHDFLRAIQKIQFFARRVRHFG
jgi:hypothetical protein